MSHTPGPWQIAGRTVYALNHDGSGRFSATVCAVGPSSASENEVGATAHLIVAAPDLYDILRGIVTLNGSRIDADLLAAAQAAVEKAEGR